MKRQIVPLAALTAAAGAITLGLFLAGVFDGDDSTATAVSGPESSALCAADQPDCDDTIVATGDIADDGDGASIAPVCAPGFPDCVETVVQDDEAGDTIDSDGDGVTSASFCAPPPGFPDYCVDTVVRDDETGKPADVQDGVSVLPVCAPDFPGCVDMIANGANGDIADAVPSIDPIVEVDGRCSGVQFASCEEQAVISALTDAERQFGVDESRIEVESAAFQEWSNACLGAADSGEACAEVITPGFVIVIDVEGTQYEYHTDLNGNVRLAI